MTVAAKKGFAVLLPIHYTLQQKSFTVLLPGAAQRWNDKTGKLTGP